MHAGEAHRLFSVLSFNFEDKLFYLEERKKCFLGFTFHFNPMQGMDAATADKLNVMLNQPFPDGSMMQIALFSSPDIHYQMKALRRLRKNANGVLKQFCASKVDYLNNAVQRPMDTSSENKLRDMRVILTCKIPCSHKVLDEEMERAGKLRKSRVKA